VSIGEIKCYNKGEIIVLVNIWQSLLKNIHKREIVKMKRLTTVAVALVLGVLVLSGFSANNQSPKKAPQTVSAANDYANFTQYMQ
jgi:hypothetical protein